MSDRGMKKYAPFKSLKGQDQAVEEIVKRKQKLSKPELAEDRQEEIYLTLSLLRKGDRVKVAYFNAGSIEETDGEILRLEPNTIKLSQDLQQLCIAVADILNIKIEPPESD